MQLSNLAKRTLSAVILAPLAIGIIILGGIPFIAMVSLAFIIMLYEWVNLTKTSKRKGLWWLAGALYIGGACFTSVYMSTIEPINSERVYRTSNSYFLSVIIIVWLSDIGAYIGGKVFGGPKLWPSVSPNKTWAGAISGIVLPLFAIGFFPFYVIDDDFVCFMIAAVLFIAIVIIAFLTECGDLLISSVKRRFGAKDSGALIPGHGGLLDRLDGLLLVMVVIGILGMIGLW